MTGNESVFAAVSKTANALASMPFHLYKGAEVDYTDPLERLITYAPNDRMTAFCWRQTMLTNVGYLGSAYSVIRRGADGVTPVRLSVVDPAKVTPYIVQEEDSIWYHVMWDDDSTEWVHNSDMFVLRNLSANGEKGISQRDVLKDSLEYDQQIKTLSLRQLQGVNNCIAVTVPSTGLIEEKRKAIIKQLLDTYEESEGRVVILQGGMTAGNIGGSSIDPRVVDIEKMTKNRVATVTNVPPHMLGDYSDTSYATAEQDMLEFLQLTMLPWVTQMEEELDRKLLTWEQVSNGWHWKGDMTALTRADTTAMANKHQQAIRGGWMTVNEVRREDNLPPVQGGDRLLISRDLLPLDMVANGATVDAKVREAILNTTHGGN